MTVDFTNEHRIAEISYLERDGRITTASQYIVGFMFKFQNSNGSRARVTHTPGVDFEALRRLAMSLYEVAVRDGPYDAAR